MKRIVPALLVLWCCGVLAIPGRAAAERAKTAPRESAGVSWRSWDAGLREATTSKRPVIVDVYTDWCGWCKRMDRDVYARADVRDYLARRFVAVRLDAESNDPGQYEGQPLTSRALANRFRVTGYPTTIFLKSDGGHLANVPGYVPADRFLLLLRYIGDGALDRGLTFDEFVKNAGGTPGQP